MRAGTGILASAGNLSLMEGAEALKPAFPQYARKMPMMELPDWFIRAFGWIDKDMRANMSALGVKRAIDNGPAERLLGRAADPARDGASRHRAKPRVAGPRLSLRSPAKKTLGRGRTFRYIGAPVRGCSSVGRARRSQ